MSTDYDQETDQISDTSIQTRQLKGTKVHRRMSSVPPGGARRAASVTSMTEHEASYRYGLPVPSHGKQFLPPLASAVYINLT